MKALRDAHGASGSSLALPADAAVKRPVVTLGSALTMTGYGLGFWWTLGGPAWSAVSSIILDEVDDAARADKDRFGTSLNWGSNLILTALSLLRLKAPLWTIPTATAAQVYLKSINFVAPLGSLRAGLMMYGVVVEGHQHQARTAVLQD